MPLSRSRRLLQNAEAALICAIEIYNKPSLTYREETFAILMVNAWELLLKAVLLDSAHNDPRCLRVYFKKRLSNSLPGKKRYVKRNRTGNEMSIGIDGCLVELEKRGLPAPPPIKANLEALIEIRDNAVHYLNASPQLAKQVLEIGTASLRNFIEIGKHWIDLDLSEYSLYLMPIGFLPSAQPATGVTLSRDEQNVVSFLASLMKQGATSQVPNYHVSLEVNLSFKRTSAAAANAVTVTNDPNALRVMLSEEDIRKQYPWDYDELTEHLEKRYLDFKINQKYHDLRKKLATDHQYMKTRYLDPGNLKSSRKDFYNPNIVAQFDKAYTLKK